MKPTVLVFGSASLVGSDFTARAGGRFGIHAAGRTDPRALGLDVERFDRLDLSDEAAVRAFLERRSRDSAWINFAARTDVDGCERERAGSSGPGLNVPGRTDTAWQMNAELPGWIAESALQSGTPFIHLSTDFVFDGLDGPYSERARPSGLGPKMSWYGYTKAIGEDRVERTGGPALVLRISYPYRTRFDPKPDFARGLLERGRSGRLYPLYSDQRITPTWVPDVSTTLFAVIGREETGALHVASPEVTTPLEFARALFQEFRLNPGPLPETALADLAAIPGRAPRPLSGGLLVERARELGIVPLNFRQGIQAMAREVSPSTPA